MRRDIIDLEYKYPLVEEIVKQCIQPNEEGKVILILGQPGSGKSVFMSQLFDKLNPRIECLTAIRAEFLGKGESPRAIYKLFEEVPDKDIPKVLLLDSLDVLAYSRRRELQEWLFYADKLKNIKGMTVVCASRSFEAEYLYPMSEQKWSEKHHMKGLPESFIEDVFKELKYDISKITENFKKFVVVPLHLRIAAEIIEKGGDPSKISTLQGIYTRLLEILKVSQEEFTILAKLANIMAEKRTTKLSYAAAGVPYLDKIRRSEKTGLVLFDDVKSNLTFSHQTLIDYLVAWQVTNANKPLVDFLLEHRQNLFIRPVIVHILGFLRSEEEQRLFNELEDVFFKTITLKEVGFDSGKVNIKTHIKLAILSHIASWSDPTKKEGMFLLRIFREAKDGQNLMTQFFSRNPHSRWFNVLKDELFLPLFKESEGSQKRFLLLRYLVNIASDYPSEMIDIALRFLEDKPNKEVIWFLRRISDTLHKIDLKEEERDRFAILLEQMVRKKGFIGWSYEIQISCSRLARIYPPKALKLYFDSIETELLNSNSKIKSTQESLVSSFKDVLPGIYQVIPEDTLKTTTEFFERFFSERYKGEKRILDEPLIHLYGEYERRFGLEAMYNWYKENILSFSYQRAEDAKVLIQTLEKSKWKTQKELALLGKLQCPKKYSSDIISKINEIISGLRAGNTKDYHSDTFIQLLEKGLPVLSPEIQIQVVSDIASLEFKERKYLRWWIWGPLHHLPESLKADVAKTKLIELNKKFGEYKYVPPFKMGGFRWGISSPVSREKLREMEPNTLYDFLINNRNLKESWQEENRPIGGAEELAQEAARALVENLEKYKEVIQKLVEKPDNDVYTIRIFTELSNKDTETIKRSLEWLIPLVVSCWKRDALQLEIVRFLTKIVVEHITENQYKLLKPAIIGLVNAKDPDKDRFFDSRKQGYSNDALTEGINTTRGSIIEVILKLTLRFTDEDLYNSLRILSEDKTISVRAALVYFLPLGLRSLGWDKCFTLFANAFKKGSEEYAETISGFLRYVPKDKFGDLKEILSEMESKKERPLGEAYAVLMSIYYLRRIHPKKEDLLSILTDPQLTQRGKEESFDLLANQVRFKENVDLCLKIIDRLLDREETLAGRVSILFMQAQIEDLDKFIPIMKKILTKPKIRGKALYHIFEYLEKCLLVNPLRVFEMLEEILLNVGEDFHDIPDHIPASHSKAPLNIVNTILECYPEQEERALKAFDKLIDLLEWKGVDDYLRAFDRL
ncbi:MAG: AAA family ATPase [bacterium]